jgi:UrcA family protein
MKKLLAIACAAALLAPSLASADRQSDVQTTQVSVSTADLDLSTSQGVATLDRRIGQALRRVCEQPDRISMTERQFYDACVTQARANLSSQLAQLRSGDYATNVKPIRPRAGRLQPSAAKMTP